MTSDAELVRQALAGQLLACEELARRWSARVVALCHARVGCGHAAEDLAQETLLRAFRGLATLQDADRFGAWLRGIAQRVCWDWHNSKQSGQVPFSSLLADGSAPDWPGPDDGGAAQAERRDELRRLMSEVERLPEEQREVLMLYYYDDVTYRDLADLLGVSTATINARLTQARASLRRRLGCSSTQASGTE